MKTLSVWIIVGVIAIVLFAWVFPWSAVVGKQVRTDIDDRFRDMARTQTVINEARGIIQKKRGDLVNRKTELLLAEDKLTGISQDCESMRAELAKREASLKRGLELLASTSENVISVSGNTYTRRQIEADVNRCASRSEQLRIRLAAAEKNRTILAGAIQQGNDAIENAKVVLDEREDKLDSDKIVIESGESTLEVQKLASTIAGGLNLDQDPYFAEVERRVAESKAALEMMAQASGSSEFIDYDVDSGPSSITKAQEYASKYLGSPAPAAPEVDTGEFLELGAEEPAAPAAE